MAPLPGPAGARAHAAAARVPCSCRYQPDGSTSTSYSSGIGSQRACYAQAGQIRAHVRPAVFLQQQFKSS